MKILFLSHYFPPEVNAPATRGYEHCRAWVQAGHQVTVITCAPSHPFGEVYPGYSNTLSHESQDGISIIRLKTYISANKGFARRTLSYISYMYEACLHAIKLESHDIVISTSPQLFNGLAGYFVSRAKNMPWVLEIRDLWPDSIIAVDAIKSKMVLNALYSVEKFLYRKAQHIVTVTDSFKEYMIGKGIKPSKISVVKNGVDLDFFDTKQEFVCDDVSLDDIPQDVVKNKFVVSYVGTHGMAHQLETLLAAAERLRNHTDIHFLLVGDGAERDKLVEIKNKKNLDNVTLARQKPKALMPWIWSVTSVSVVQLRKDPVFESVIPSKIFESMAMQKPIILAVKGECARMIAEAGSGIVIEPADDEALASAILHLKDAPDTLSSMGQAGRRYVEEKFDRNVLAKQFEEILFSVFYRSKNCFVYDEDIFEDLSPQRFIIE